jgi:hypothetical protein
MDVVGSHHGLIAFGLVAILDAFEDPLAAFAEERAIAFSPLVGIAFSGFLGESSSHSKASVGWNSEDVFLPQLFHKLRGFSSSFRKFSGWQKKYHAWLRITERSAKNLTFPA